MTGLGRRRLLAGALGGGLSLAARAAAAAAADLADPVHGDAGLRLCWIYNAEFAGEFQAQSRGFYRQEGFGQVRLLAGGPGATPVEIDVVQRRCLLGITSIDQTAAAIGEGGALVTLGAQYQRAAFCIVSLPQRPIHVPADMIGRDIGVQAQNQVIFSTFLAAAGIDPARVRTVPVQFDPTPLVAGEVDGWVGYVTNEPNILRARGLDPVVCLFADHGYPLLMQTMVASSERLVEDRAALKALLRAEIRGWQANLRDPDEGARLAVEVYGRGLGLDASASRLQSRTENGLMIGPETEAHGLFMVGDEAMRRNVEVLRGAGLDVTRDRLFDLSLLGEIYDADPALRAA